MNINFRTCHANSVLKWTSGPQKQSWGALDFWLLVHCRHYGPDCLADIAHQGNLKIHWKIICAEEAVTEIAGLLSQAQIVPEDSVWVQLLPGRWSVGQEVGEANAIHFYSCGLMWGEPSSQINVVMWWLNLMTWEIPVLEFLCNCNNDLFHYLLTCWLHGNLGYSIICYIETEQLDLFVSVKEGQNLSKF